MSRNHFHYLDVKLIFKRERINISAEREHLFSWKYIIINFKHWLQNVKALHIYNQKQTLLYIDFRVLVEMFYFSHNLIEMDICNSNQTLLHLDLYLPLLFEVMSLQSSENDLNPCLSSNPFVIFGTFNCQLINEMFLMIKYSDRVTVV